MNNKHGIQISEIDPAGNVLQIFASVREAGRVTHINPQSILDRCNGKIKKEFALSGTSFRYYDKEENNGI